MTDQAAGATPKPKRVRPSRAKASTAQAVAGDSANGSRVVDIHNQLSSGVPAPDSVLSSPAARPDAPADPA